MEESSNKSSFLIDSNQFFSDCVSEALRDQKIKTFPQVESYLVHVLKFYMHTNNLHDTNIDSTEKSPTTLAELLLLSQTAEPVQKINLLKKLGERSLYVSGFFADSLNRKIVDINYYVQMGGTAYEALAHCTREDIQAKVFFEISRKFSNYVDVFSYISHKSQITSSQNILQVYDRYLKTGSDVAKKALIESGILSLPKDPAKGGRQ